MTWSRQLFQFILCGHSRPLCWTSQERELGSRVGFFRSRLKRVITFWGKADAISYRMGDANSDVTGLEVWQSRSDGLVSVLWLLVTVPYMAHCSYRYILYLCAFILMLPLELLFAAQICTKSFVGRTFAQDPTRELTAFSIPPSWFRGWSSRWRAGKGKKRGERRRGRKM